jgi:hypothetical protein
MTSSQRQRVRDNGTYNGDKDTDGNKHGQGTLTFPDGRKYEGEWQHDKKHGKGTFTYANGDAYVGEYRQGNRHGKGIHTKKTNGRTYEHEYEDGVKVKGTKRPSAAATAVATDNGDDKANPKRARTNDDAPQMPHSQVRGSQGATYSFSVLLTLLSATHALACTMRLAPFACLRPHTIRVSVCALCLAAQAIDEAPHHQQEPDELIEPMVPGPVSTGERCDVAQRPADGEPKSEVLDTSENAFKLAFEGFKEEWDNQMKERPPRPSSPEVQLSYEKQAAEEEERQLDYDEYLRQVVYPEFEADVLVEADVRPKGNQQVRTDESSGLLRCDARACPPASPIPTLHFVFDLSHCLNTRPPHLVALHLPCPSLFHCERCAGGGNGGWYGR